MNENPLWPADCLKTFAKQCIQGGMIMGMKKWALLCASIAAGLSCQSLLATPITVDGNLSDWGITVGDNNGSSFGSLAGNMGLIGAHLEDTSDISNNYYLGPGNGGQNYDAEFMAVARQGNSLFVALVTGQRPDNGAAYYSPGDFRFETSAGRFGVEAGGGKGYASSTATSPLGKAVTEGAAGSTYTLKGNGETLAYSDAAAAQTAGSLWRDVSWILDPIAPKEAVQFQINALSRQVGMADYIFTRNSITSQHAIIEFAIDLGVFGGVDLYSLHWRPSSGSDEMNVTLNLSTQVPEPGSLALLMAGGLGMAAALRRRAVRRAC